MVRKAVTSVVEIDTLQTTKLVKSGDGKMYKQCLVGMLNEGTVHSSWESFTSDGVFK